MLSFCPQNIQLVHPERLLEGSEINVTLLLFLVSIARIFIFAQNRTEKYYENDHRYSLAEHFYL